MVLSFSLVTTLLALALLLNSSGAAPGAPTTVAKFLVTNIDVQHSSKSGDGHERVEFHEFMKASHTTAVVLRDIQDTGRKHRSPGLFGKICPIYSGIPLDPSRVADQIKKEALQAGSKPKSPTLLLCVHGFNTQPSGWLKDCAGYKGEFIVVPVLWPASDQPAFWKAYEEDRSHAKGTGESFRPLLECLGNISGKKSLMCHSMGNFILKFSAPIQPPKDRLHRFEDIFMVAADVDRDVFEKQEAGKRILSMVNHRVHVLYSKKDFALALRQIFTIRKPALGFFGPKEKDDVERVKCDAFPRKDVLGHSYFFGKEAIAYYESQQK